MNVKQLKKILAKLPEDQQILYCEDGVYKDIFVSVENLTPDPSQEGYALERALYRAAERGDTEIVKVLCVFADD